MPPHLRIARPVTELAATVTQYGRGLGLVELGRFEDHEGFDGVMLGLPGADFHFEFTHCRTRPVRPAPTPEDLLVFYHPAQTEWDQACSRMLEAGFIEVSSFNPYWAIKGRTFEDGDGYRVVLERDDWGRRGSESG
jgi:YycE-like protein